MTCVELFYHCDHYGCEAHAYVPGEVVAPGEDSHRLPKEMPVGWRKANDGKVYCHNHGPAEAAT